MLIFSIFYFKKKKSYLYKGSITFIELGKKTKNPYTDWKLIILLLLCISSLSLRGKKSLRFTFLKLQSSTDS